MALRRMPVFEQVGELFTPQNVAALRFAGELRCASPRQAYALYENKPPKKAKSHPCGTGRSR